MPFCVCLGVGEVLGLALLALLTALSIGGKSKTPKPCTDKEHDHAAE
jgi:hypothetical protein